MTGNDIKWCLARPVKHTIVFDPGSGRGVAGEDLGVGRKCLSEILKLLALKRYQNQSLSLYLN